MALSVRGFMGLASRLWAGPRPTEAPADGTSEDLLHSIQAAWMGKGQTVKIRLKGQLDAGFLKGGAGDVFDVPEARALMLLQEKPDMVELLEGPAQAPQEEATAGEDDQGLDDDQEDLPGAPPAMKSKARAARTARAARWAGKKGD